MKKFLIITVIAFNCYYCFAQNTFPSTGNVGIGTNNPGTPLDVAGETRAPAFRVASALGDDVNGSPWYGVGFTNFLLPNSPHEAVQLAGFWGLNFQTGGGQMVLNYQGQVGIGTNNPVSPFHLKIDNTFSTIQRSSSGTYAGQTYITGPDNATTYNFFTGLRENSDDFHIYNGQEGSDAMTITKDGSFVGIGSSVPQANLHVFGEGAVVDGGNNYEYSGAGLIVQGNTGGRSSTSGAQIEFVIPANSDGSNMWGQGRIITVAGNGNGGDATGKMIIGTRRYYNKLGTGTQWYYGNDIVINGSGNVGVGTTNPDQLLTVNGTVHAKQVNVDVNIVPDYVFNKGYKLRTLAEVNRYIALNKHLPEIPSAKTLEKTGINVSELNMKLLQKVEELTLYLIEKDKQISNQQKTNQILKGQLTSQQSINEDQNKKMASQQKLIEEQQKQLADQQKINQLFQQQISDLAKQIKH